MLYSGLKDVLRAFDEHGWKGSFTRGLWQIGNGGYDCWFVLTYKSLPVVQCVNGELESTCWVEECDKSKLFNKILEVYDHLKVRDSEVENDVLDVELFLKNIDESKITDSARVSLIWDSYGIAVNLDYSYDENVGCLDSALCFCEIYDDGEPNSFVWEEAQQIGRLLSERYNLPLDITKDEEFLKDLDRVIGSCEMMSKNGDTGARSEREGFNDREER